jgi:hypothetical protein
MAKLDITIKIPESMIPVLANGLWQGGRPTDPPLVEADPLASPPIEEVPAPPLSDKQCVKRWIQRELQGRYEQYYRETWIPVPPDIMSTLTQEHLNTYHNSKKDGID